jgi:hypothetical protein
VAGPDDGVGAVVGVGAADDEGTAGEPGVAGAAAWRDQRDRHAKNRRTRADAYPSMTPSGQSSPAGLELRRCAHESHL